MEFDGDSLAGIISGSLYKKHVVEVCPSAFLIALRILRRTLLGDLWSGVSFISMTPGFLTRSTRSFDRDGPGE